MTGRGKHRGAGPLEYRWALVRVLAGELGPAVRDHVAGRTVMAFVSAQLTAWDRSLR